ncbi:MAG: DUF5671 domain-containing protein [Cyanobacteria bacterium P01_H01_bin.15]
MSDITHSEKLVEFILTARERGAGDGTIFQVLRSRGWSQEEVEIAFAASYEQLTGLPVPTPQRKREGSARDAFLYLLSFGCLATWTQALGEIGFIAVERLVDDPVDGFSEWNFYGLASSAARLLVVFPIYLFLMRLLLTDLANNPDKYQSGVRKWLTYFSLLIAAVIAIGNLVVFLTEFLRGSLTLTFSLKSIIVLTIAGGIFGYYLRWLQRRPPGME